MATNNKLFKSVLSRYKYSELKNNEVDTSQYLFFSQDLTENKGCKTYYRTTPDKQADLVKLLENNFNLYETLPLNVPVKPYFDLEIERDDFSREEMDICFDDFFEFLLKEIDDVFGVKLEKDDCIILDSCRERKLSFHIIINNHICFENVKYAHTKFIEYLTERLENPKDDEKQKFERLQWVKNKPKTIIDINPYSTNQQFRLINQSKKGTPHTLKNTNAKWKIEDTFIRLFAGVGDRRILTADEMSRLEVVCKDKKTNKTVKKKMGTVKDVGYVTTGLTIYERNKMTLNDWNKLPPYKKYLAHIPNDDQDRGIYLNIAMAVASAGGYFEDFEEWAKLSLKRGKKGTGIKKKEFDRFRRDKEQTGEIHNYSLPYLRRLAKTANPDIFRTVKEALALYCNLDKSNIKVIQENCAFVSQDNDNILDPAKLLILYAYMGRGEDNRYQTDITGI